MKISIITATFNSGKFIESCIKSILKQNYKKFEIIIIDGLSTDSTIKKIKTLLDKHNNIKFFSEKDLGIYHALNKGIEKANGDIIGFVHSDDLLYNKNVLSNIIDVFKNSNIDGVYGDLQYVEKQNTNKVIRYWKSKDFKPNLINKGWTPPHPTLYLKKKVYEKHGFFDLNYKISSDYDFMTRIFMDNTFYFKYIPKVITKMRVGGISNKNIKNVLIKSLEDYKVIYRNGSGGIITLLRKNTSKIKQFIKNS
jgi:glycosyltransferase